MKTKALIFFVLLVICLPLQSQDHLLAETIGDSLRKYFYGASLTGLSNLVVLYGLCYCTNRLIASDNPVISDLRQFQKTNNDNQQITLFAHGLAETSEQASWYISQEEPPRCFIHGDLYSYDYPDATTWFWRVNFTKTALGQEYEVNGLQNAYRRLIAQEPTKQIVLMGMSRGAATILNFLAKHNPAAIKALVLESPFDSTASVVKNILQKYYLDMVPGMQAVGHYIMSSIFWRHSPNGMQPIDSIEKIDKKLPLLFVCSQKDALVPAQSTIALYQKLKNIGYEKVHIFVSKSGKHGRILQSDDGINYEKALNAFYKRYELLHDEHLAAEGDGLLDIIPRV